MKYNISLNFLSLSNSDFSFKVYRRKVEHNEKSWDNNIYKYRLPATEGKYTSFWVGFESFENSELFECNSIKTNIELTKQLLVRLLMNNVNKLNLKIHQKSNRFNKKRKNIIIDEITDSNDQLIGARTIWVEPYFLKASNKFGFLIDYSFIKAKEYPFNREVQKHSLSLNSDYRSNVNYNIDKYQIISDFLTKYYSQLKLIREDISINDKLENISADTLNVKKYIFNSNKTDISQFNGVMNNGPYEPVRAEPMYFYVFKTEYKNQSTDLLKALNGLSYQTFNGIQKFNLKKQTKDNTVGINIDDYSTDEIQKIIADVKKHNSANPIIISVFPASEERFYYELKNTCLKENIPSQSVHVETISNSNKLKWSVGSIALQIFSKLSGVPWIVEPSHENCLIVGIGQSHKYDKNKKQFERFFSYSVLVDSSGKFIEIKQLANETDKTKFLDGVAHNVSKIIEENEEYTKIVFHIPQKIGKDEIERIESTIRSINASVELSIIKINDDPKFTGYNKDENTLIPYESSFIKLSERDYLLWTEGLNYHNKRAVKKYGNPLLITFYYSNQQAIFNNHRKYLQDILNLSGANYRGFNAKALPVSVYYPKLIADFSKHFKELDLDLSTEDTKKTWFL